MDITVLRKYARVHKIKTKSKVNKEELAASVSRHFANQTVKELDTITCFLYTAHYKGKVIRFICLFNVSLTQIPFLFLSGLLDSVLRLPLHI